MTTSEPFDEGARPSPQESLEVIDDTMAVARRAFGFSDAPLYLAWGLAWVVLFSAAQLIAAPAYAPLSHLPPWVAGVAIAVSVGAATLFSAAHSARQSRGIGGASEALGRRIGISWAATFGSAILVVVLLGLDGPLAGALFVFAVAVLYMGQGAGVRPVQPSRGSARRWGTARGGGVGRAPSGGGARWRLSPT